MIDSHQSAVDTFLDDLGTIEKVDLPLAVSLRHVAYNLDLKHSPTLATEYRRLVAQLAMKYKNQEAAPTPLAAFLAGVQQDAG